MKKNIIISMILILITIALTIVSVIVLPDTVITQISITGNDPTIMNKYVAIAIPLLLGLGGGLCQLLNKGTSVTPIIVSIAGIIVYIVMLVVNL